MNRHLDRHNSRTITKDYNMKKRHFHATNRVQAEAKKRKNELIERTRKRLKEEAWEEARVEVIQLIPGGETFSISGQAGVLGTVIGYDPKRQLFLGVGHRIEERDLTGEKTVGYPTKLSEKGTLVFDRERLKEIGKCSGEVVYCNEYGCVVHCNHPPGGESVPIGIPANGEALLYHVSLPEGRKKINLWVDRRSGEVHFRLPEQAKGMSGSPIMQGGRMVAVFTHGDEKGNAGGIQMVEIIGGLLSEYEEGEEI